MCYVFVVCGAAEHVTTLNLSLQYLRKFTNKPIVVVTDTSRTSESVEHDVVIDVRTPADMNDHQASIFLKTSLHRILPRDVTRYCYLDSDVIAVRPGVDEIFEQMCPPITFVADHCRLPEFSPYAMRCGCREKARPGIERFESVLNRYRIPPSRRMDMLQKELGCVQERWRILESKMMLLSRTIRKWHSVRKWMSSLADFVRKRTGFNLDSASNQWLDEDGQFLAQCKPFRTLQYAQFLASHGYDFDSTTRTWTASDGFVVQRDVVSQIEHDTEFRYDPVTDTWYGAGGALVYKCCCDHLRQAIKVKFGTTVRDAQWQHWNGGVFLFDRSSHSFLDTWHAWTIKTFSDPAWQTRDQGTLIATAWKFGLQNHPVLHPKFNLIADYHSDRLQFKTGADFEAGIGFSVDEFRTVIEPAFVHIYHHWGDRNWEVWRWVESILGGAEKKEMVQTVPSYPTDF